jgi:acetoin utilization deacetylase AcuC-like enzyme
MHTFYHPGHVRHDPAVLHKPGTPNKNSYYSEVARRGELLYQAIIEADLGPVLPPADLGLEPIGEVHDHGMITLLQKAYALMAQEGKAQLVIPTTFNLRKRHGQRQPQSIWGLLGHYCFDIGSPIFAGTWEAAYWSAQTALSAASHIVETGSSHAYALCRPPGHHAAADYYGGFCFLNNAAIAANWLVNQGLRVAILDIDYHHGNGTQEIFYNRSEVLFCSIHADPLDEYPYFWGYADEFGSGPGRNSNFNYPLPCGTHEPEYLLALEPALGRVQRFVPNLLLVSLGVDTLAGDPVGGFKLSVATMGVIGQRLLELNLPILVVQEGGYLLSDLGPAVLAFLNGIKGA